MARALFSQTLTPSGLAAVDPVFRPEPATDDYFSLLGVPRAFAQDTAELERLFYALSRALHPDHFSGKGAASQTASVERMSTVNQAYATLKNPRSRREYLLELEGVKVPQGTTVGNGQLPMELAEQWFELQEALMEGTPESAAALREFRAQLDVYRAQLGADIQMLERGYDEAMRTAGSPASRENFLQELGRKLQAENYLASLERNIARWVK